MNVVTLYKHASDQMVRRSLRNESALVKDPPHARWLLLRTSAIFLTLLIALVIQAWVQAPWYAEAVEVTLTLLALWATLSLTRQLFAYRNGWIDGRAAMLDSWLEANARGMDYQDWVKAEISRDFMVMGADPLAAERREQS